MKKWITVMSLKGHQIRILDGAGPDDCHDYIVTPPIDYATYSTIDAAVKAIKENSQ